MAMSEQNQQDDGQVCLAIKVGACTASEIMAATGLEMRRTDRALQRLRRAARIRWQPQARKWAAA